MTRCMRLLMSCLIAIGSPLALAEQASVSDILNTDTKSGKDYFSIGFGLNEFRSVNLILSEVSEDGSEGSVVQTFFPETAQTYGAFGVMGTYITQYVKTELRFGTGLKDDTIQRALDVNIHYWLAWYMGATYPITDYMSAYGLYGVSHYDADVTRREIRITVDGGEGTLPQTYNAMPSSSRMEEDLFGTSFSTSWLLGLDLRITPEWYLAFEYGRLLRDTDTNIKVYQGSMQLRYEY